VEASIIIPTYQRPQKLQACLRALGQQTTDRFEVLVGFDGPDPAGVEGAFQAATSSLRARLRLIECPRSGYTTVRNTILREARGRIMLSTNDDVIPEPQWVQTHIEAQAQALAKRHCVVIVGSSPWVVHQPDRLFDRLIRETSMVFFYAPMDTPVGLAQPDKDWGFRHSWGLNISAPMDAVHEVGNFTVFPAWYGYEDNEIAFKLRERYGAPVLYRPQARLWHDHRMEPRAYLSREFSLGYAAWGFAKTSPQCARAMFGREIAAHPEISYSREFLHRERTAAARAVSAFESLASIPASVLDNEHAPSLTELLYQQHLLLKRWMWRAGLVAACERRDVSQVNWPER
jgi:GT2 family glycosyltransferase